MRVMKCKTVRCDVMLNILNKTNFVRETLNPKSKIKLEKFVTFVLSTSKKEHVNTDIGNELCNRSIDQRTA
jgi:hypothetical protein